MGNIETTIKLGSLFRLQLYPNCRFWLTTLAEGTPLLKLWWRSLMAGCTFGFQKTNIWWSIFERLRKTSVNYKNISTCQYVEIQHVACTCYVLHIGIYYMSYDMTMTSYPTQNMKCMSVHIDICIYTHLLSVIMENKISYMHMASGIHNIVWFRGVCMRIYTQTCAPLKTACAWLTGSSIPRVHALTRSSEWTTCARSRRCTQGLDRVPPRPSRGRSVFPSLLGWVSLVISSSAAITSRV